MANAFTKLGVGFRVDGMESNGKIDSIERITKEGINAQVLNSWFMLNVRHMNVEGTAIALDTAAPRIYKRAQDLFNETAVCVARSLFGATAFPERETQGTVCLWAVDVTGLSGFDTEKYQNSLGGDKQWRPGEKAYRMIPKERVIGYIKVNRQGAPSDGGGWKFQIPHDMAWTFLNGTAAQRYYCTTELEAWRGPAHVVSGATTSPAPDPGRPEGPHA